MRRSLMPLLVLLSLLRPSYTCSSICSPPENSRLRFDLLSVPPAADPPSPPFAVPVAPTAPSALRPSATAAAAATPIADRPLEMDGSVASPVAAGVATIVRPLLLLP
uniref:Putative secreted protein n=1 Tax=Anopheles darlingi TaxID=43151 RepID=A0A2M4D4C5_ANODA